MVVSSLVSRKTGRGLIAACCVTLASVSAVHAGLQEPVRLNAHPALQQAGSNSGAFAVAVAARVDSERDGHWEQQENHHRWTVTLEVEGANSVGLRVSGWQVAEHTQLRVLDKAGQEWARYGPDDGNRSGNLWVRHVPGNTVQLVLETPAKQPRPRLRITEVQAGAASTRLKSDKDVSSCARNYRCESPAQYSQAGRATVWWSWGNKLGCSGTLVHTMGDTPGDTIPLLVTADHCTEVEHNTFHRQEAAESLMLYYQRETPCGEPLESVFAVEGYAESFDADAVAWLDNRDTDGVLGDVVVFRLNRMPRRASGAYFAGVDVRQPPVTSEGEYRPSGDDDDVVENFYLSDMGEVFSIHHSAVLAKQYSSVAPGEMVEVTRYTAESNQDVQPIQIYSPGVIHVYSPAEFLGVIAGGASGGGWFTPEGKLVSTVIAGSPNDCADAQQRDLHRIVTQGLFAAWQQSNLQSALDPRGTGLMVTEGLEPDFAPDAAFTVDCDGHSCVFDSSASFDSEGIVQWAWDLGDGTQASTARLTHRYTATGTFPVRLTLTDTVGQSSSLSQTVVVRAPGSGALGGWVFLLGLIARRLSAWSEYFRLSIENYQN